MNPMDIIMGVARNPTTVEPRDIEAFTGLTAQEKAK
jgi:hypothetical protein